MSGLTGNGGLERLATGFHFTEGPVWLADVSTITNTSLAASAAASPGGVTRRAK